MNAPKGIVVTLVHGTWGRGVFPRLVPRLSSHPRWFEEKSAFRAELQALLSAGDRLVVIQGFDWSGSNSLKSRQAAATGLVAKLNEAKRDFPDCAHAVIGHSHGGNVALTALLRLGELERAWLLVTLATPFLSIKDVDPHAPIIKKLRIFFSFMYSIIGLAVFVRLTDDAAGVSLGEAAVALCIGLVVLEIFKILARGSSVDIVSAKYDEARTDAAALVLRSIDDEAYLALLSGSIASKLSYLIFSLISFVVWAVWYLVACTLASAFVGIVRSFITGSTFDHEKLRFWMMLSGIPVAAFILLVGCMMILLGVMALGRSVNGRELLFGGIVREINVQSVPDSQGGVEVRTLPSEAKNPSSLRHSIYNHSLCAPEIAKWLLARL